jgi:hypothetical protein
VTGSLAVQPFDILHEYASGLHASECPSRFASARFRDDPSWIMRACHFSHWSFLALTKQIQSESKVIPLLFSATFKRAIGACTTFPSWRGEGGASRCEAAGPRLTLVSRFTPHVSRFLEAGRERRRWSQIVCRSRKVNAGPAP